jgi:hypothetical protein
MSAADHTGQLLKLIAKFEKIGFDVNKSLDDMRKLHKEVAQEYDRLYALDDKGRAAFAAAGNHPDDWDQTPEGAVLRRATIIVDEFQDQTEDRHGSIDNTAANHLGRALSKIEDAASWKRELQRR